MVPAVRYAIASFVASLVILAIKTAAWWATGSAVLLADAAESSLDVVTASLLVLAVRYSSRPPDAGHPWGHGKVEYFSSGFQGALILAAGVGVGVEGVRRLLAGAEPGSLAEGLGLSALATFANLALALTLIRVGQRVRSPALEADGRHNLTDVLTTLGGWVGLGLAWLTGIWALDPLFALVVAAQILFTGGTLVRNAVNGLMDAALDPVRLEALESALRGALDPDATLLSLRARASSERVFVDCVVTVPGERTVASAHSLCDVLERAAREAVPGAEVHVHVEPSGVQ